MLNFVVSIKCLSIEAVTWEIGPIYLKRTVDIDRRVTESSHHTVGFSVENIELVWAVVELLLQGIQQESQVGAGSALSIEINVVAGVVPTEQGILSCRLELITWTYSNYRIGKTGKSRKKSRLVLNYFSRCFFKWRFCETSLLTSDPSYR